MDVARQIEALIRARYSVIYIVSREEERVEQTLRTLGEKLRRAVFTWSATKGVLHEDGRGSGASTAGALQGLEFALGHHDPGIFVMRDLDAHLGDPLTQRKLRDVARAFRSAPKTLVILSPVLAIPPRLENDITVIDYPLPDHAAVAAILEGLTAQLRDHPSIRIDLDDEGREAMVRAAAGLTAFEAEDAFARAVILNGKLDRDDIATVLSAKQQIIRKSGVLEFCPVEQDLEAIGGLGALKDWLRKREKAFTDSAREFGLPEPRGVLLIGARGCGKSLTARAASSLWGLPLLRLDLGAVLSGTAGSPETSMRRATGLAETLAPCILWLTDLPRDLSDTARALGSLTTWLREKTLPVFVIATADDVTALPPGLMGTDCFDEVFFVDLPREDEREEIFRIHIARREREPARYDLPGLATEAEGFSGSEIERVVISALYDAFDRGGELAQEDLLANIHRTAPRSKTGAEALEALREWARARARPAST